MFQVNDLVRSIRGGLYVVLETRPRTHYGLTLQRVTSGRITTERNPYMFTLVGHNYKPVCVHDWRLVTWASDLKQCTKCDALKEGALK